MELPILREERGSAWHASKCRECGSEGRCLPECKCACNLEPRETFVEARKRCLKGGWRGPKNVRRDNLHQYSAVLEKGFPALVLNGLKVAAHLYNAREGTRILPWAQEVVRTFNTYTEVQGDDLWLIARGAMPQNISAPMPGEGMLTLMKEGTVFLTGNTLAETPFEVRFLEPDLLPRLFSLHGMYMGNLPQRGLVRESNPEPFRRFREAYEGLGYILSPDGREWEGKCPYHRGQSLDSLHVAVDAEGNVGLHCFSGCTAEEITGCLGLKVSDLFVSSTPRLPRTLEELRLRMEELEVPMLSHAPLSPGSRRSLQNVYEGLVRRVSWERHFSPEHEWAPYSLTFACTFCSYSKPTVVDALRELVEGGFVLRPGGGHFYKLSQPQDDHKPTNGQVDVPPSKRVANWLTGPWTPGKYTKGEKTYLVSCG